MKVQKAYWKKYKLHFVKPSGTSRGVLTDKPSYFLFLKNEKNETGIGECNLIPGLSPDEQPELEKVLDRVCEKLEMDSKVSVESFGNFPALKFAVEMAQMDLTNGGNRLFYKSAFTEGKVSIPINGLVWMGTAGEIQKQLQEKLKIGFRCIKLKIGALNLDEELALLKNLRKQYAPETLEIRVDANGAFLPGEAPAVLEELGKLQIHSIEQPIKAGQWKEMADLCKNTAVPIALDEELIGLKSLVDKAELISVIKPQYLILKPSLVGGFTAAETWVSLAVKHGLGWWATSALESNIGLNAIAQWCAVQNNTLPQGLGTGQLFTNNIPSPLEMEGPHLCFKPKKHWNLSALL